LDESSSENATATFSIIGDDKELWHSDSLGKTNAPQSVNLSIKNVKRLILKTVAPAQSRSRAQADWIEPSLSRETALLP
jgi:hypothetical protein